MQVAIGTVAIDGEQLNIEKADGSGGLGFTTFADVTAAIDAAKEVTFEAAVALAIEAVGGPQLAGLLQGRTITVSYVVQIQ